MSNLAGTYLVQAEEHLAAGNVKKAIDLLEHAAALGPSPAEAGRIYWNLAEAYRRLGQPDKAIQWSRRADATGFQPIRPPEKSTPSGAAKKRLVFSWKLVAIFAAGLILLAGFSWLVYRGLTVTAETNPADRPSGSDNLAKPPDAASDRSGISQPAGQEDLPALIRRITPSTVLIVTYDRQDKLLGLGTGFFVNPNGEVVTNRHVLEGASRAEIKTNQGIVYPVERVLAEDEQADLIRVSVHMPGQSVTALSMSRIVPETGQKVIVVGNPLGLETTVSDGIVSAVRDIPAVGNIIQLTAPISPGSSGSPVINMKGEVIGVAVAQIIRGQNLNFAIPAERVLRLNTRNSRTFAQWDADVKKQWHADAEEIFRKGLFLVWKEDYQEALACFEEVIEKKPDYAEAHFFLGLCRAGLGDYGGAITAYKQALQINPDYGWAHYGLGLTYLLMGDRTSAMEEYRILSNLDSELAAELYQTINE